MINLNKGDDMNINEQLEIEKLINELADNNYSKVNGAVDVAISRCNIKKSKQKHYFKFIYEFINALGIDESLIS